MASASYQQEPTDILDERPDSASILADRLENWSHAVSILLEYAHQEYASQSAITSHLNKQRKTVNQIPNFLGSSVTGGTHTQGLASGSPSIGTSSPGTPSTNAAGSPSSNPGSIANSFRILAQQNDILLRESDSVAQSIKGTVIPPLETLHADLEKHQKTLRTHGQKAIKEVEKSREHTARQLEALGKAVSTAGVGNQKPDPKNDPYNLHRRVRSVAADQIQRENQQAESNVNNQNNFGSLEQHTIEVIQNATAQLDALTRRFFSTGSSVSQTIAQCFSSVDAQTEWSQFVNTNRSLLVPSQGFQRDPSRVTFANSDHESTKPLMEGILTRKGTVFKGKKPGYYVLTPAGFLHEYKSADYVEDPMPELSLYIPESQLGGLPHASSGDLSFKISSRDSGKVLGSRHKYTFIASSYEELAAWHLALSRVAGTTGAEVLEGDEDEGESIQSSPGVASGTAAVPGVVPAVVPVDAHSGAPVGAPVMPAGSATEFQAIPSTPPRQSGNPAAVDIPGAAGATPTLPGATTTTTGPTETYNAQPVTPGSSYMPNAAAGSHGEFGAATSVVGAGATGLGVAGLGSATTAQAGQGVLSKEPLQSRQVNPSGPNYSNFSEPKFGVGEGVSSKDRDSSSGLRDTLPGSSNYSSGIGNKIGDERTPHGDRSLGVGDQLQDQVSGLRINRNDVSGTGAQGLENTEVKSKHGDSSPPGLGVMSASGAGFSSSKYSNNQHGFEPEKSTTSWGNTVPDYGNGRSNAHESPDYGVRSQAQNNHLYEAKTTPSAGLNDSKISANSSPNKSVNRQSQVPHYRISPTKEGTLKSDDVSGLGVGGTFGGIPVERDAEQSAKGAREHDAEIGVLGSNGRYDWKKQDLHHLGHRHDASEGLPEANNHPRSAAHYAAASGALGADNGASNVSRPISAEPFAVVAPGSSTLKEEVSNERTRYGNSSGPANQTNKTVVTQAYNPPVAVPVSTATSSTRNPGTSATSSDGKETFRSVKPTDVQYSTPATSEVPDIAAAQANPLLGSTTDYTAPSARPQHASYSAKDVSYSTPSTSDVPSIAAGQANPLLGSTTEYNAPSAQNKSTVHARDVSYSTPSTSAVPEIAAGQANPLLGSNTTYGALKADTSGRSAGGFGNLESHDVEYSTPTVSVAPGIAAGNTNPLVGSTTEYEAPISGGSQVHSSSANQVSSTSEGKTLEDPQGFYTPKQSNTATFQTSGLSTGNATPGGGSDLGSKSPNTHVGSGSHGRTGSAFSGQDTGSRLDPLSSRYEPNLATSAGLDGSAVGRATGASGSSGINYEGFEDASETKHHQAPGQNRVFQQTGNTAAGHGTDSSRQYHSSHGTSANTGATGGGPAVSGGSGNHGAEVGQQGTGGGSGAPGYNSKLGHYSSEDYSSYAPHSGVGSASAVSGPGSGAGQAQASSAGSGRGQKLGALGGAVGAVSGIAGAAGVPGGSEVGEASQAAGQLGSNGIGGAIKSQIPGVNEAGQIKQAFHGDASGLAKNEVRNQIPGANEASQLSSSAKELRGGNAGSKFTEQATKEADKSSGGKVGLGKKIANVFK